MHAANLYIPDALQKCSKNNTLHVHCTSCDPIRDFTHETKHSKLTVLKGGQASNIRHCHLAIKFRCPFRAIPTESINRIHTPEGTPQTSAPCNKHALMTHDERKSGLFTLLKWNRSAASCWFYDDVQIPTAHRSMSVECNVVRLSVQLPVCLTYLIWSDLI